MKISIVTAVYNNKDTVACAIKSVGDQDYPIVEHIVQDGGSTDGTLTIIEKMASATAKLVSEADSGLYDAINRGIRRATGDVIGLMHSDDFFPHNRVLSLVAETLCNSQFDGVYGDLQYVSKRNPNRVVRHWQSGGYTHSKLTRGWMPPHPTLYLRREVFERWGLYDTHFRIAADYDAMLRYLVKGQINLAYIPQVLVRMRVGGESNRSIGRILLKSREDLQAIRRNGVGGVSTLAWKNLSKLPQFLKR